MVSLLLKLFVKDYKNTSDIQVKKRYGLLGSIFGLITNFLLFAAKLVLGFLFKFYSIIADSINNLSDFANNFLAIFGFKISAKKADADHPFGHQRMEYIMSLIISTIIIALGVLLAYKGIKDIIEFSISMAKDGHPIVDTIFSDEGGKSKLIILLSILSAAILAKAFQSYVYYSLGKRINSMQLKVLSRDSLNDVISTILVIAGVVITYLTSYKLDGFFTAAVSILVIISGITLLKNAASILLGQKPSKEFVHNLVQIISSHKEIIGIHDLNIHYYGDNIYATIHLEMDSRLTLNQSHSIVDHIEKEALDKMKVILTSHIDPVDVNDENTSKYLSLTKEAISTIDDKMTIHDFRIKQMNNRTKLVFDVVSENSYSSIDKKEEFENKVKEYFSSKIEDEIELEIYYDDLATDYLLSERENQIVDK